VRLLFDEEKIISISTFDTATQAKQVLLDEALAIPAEPSEPGAAGRVADWLGGDSLWIVEEGVSSEEFASGRAIYTGASSLRLSSDDLDFGAKPHRPLLSGAEAAGAEMKRLAGEGLRVILYSLNSGEDRRMQEIFDTGSCQFLIGPLQKGFVHPEMKLAVLTASEIFNRHYRPALRWKSAAAGKGKKIRFGELRLGDYVVHRDYGIARYRGLRPVDLVDCLKLEFRGSDVLYVPMTEFGLISRYSGAEGKRPKLSSLDTRTWEEVKRNVREGVRELAQELLRLQAARAGRLGRAFGPQTVIEREFAEAFPYEETPDQAAAIQDVFSDMESPRPMDRLVVGDVGFGKTEVAMRACLKCISGNQQAAVLVPTTILADQHFRTFSSRFADYPIRVGVLSRFQSKTEQAKTIATLRAGGIDVVIGTSRLLQKDVSFKELGLAVIDEEHRFGVRDKERLKSMRSQVDVLSLSATPIPRTLNQAMQGVRSLSVIESAPTGRHPILTKVGPFSEAMVAEAIREELGRQGQAYYVHNRVRSLDKTLARLRELVPEARFGMVHGQMRPDAIEQAMWDFFHRKFDVLVASTIIESGLDIPSVNTLIVENASDFGLAQLYQLRGRIGRETQRAFSYFFYPEHAEDLTALSEEARKRLTALSEFTGLGSGIFLAMRDLEIRGAGELLGSRQHGFVNAVGIDLYSDLLTEELKILKGGAKSDRPAAPSVDLAVSAFIPETYLPGEIERLGFYKRLLRASLEELGGLEKELTELSGPPPESVQNLFAILRLRARAGAVGLSRVAQKGKEIELFFRADAAIPPKAALLWENEYRGRIRFLHSESGDGISVTLEGNNPVAWLSDFLLDIESNMSKRVRAS
jgi:transcription-repair coupling factor (superfamily II helicase)